MASWSSPSSSLSALGCPSPSNDISLSATVFGMNRLSVQNRPRNVLKCLEADRSGLNKSGLLSRELYLSDGLEKADRMYTADVFGHHSCVNTVALSNLGQEFVVSGVLYQDVVKKFCVLQLLAIESLYPLNNLSSPPPFPYLSHLLPLSPIIPY